MDVWRRKQLHSHIYRIGDEFRNEVIILYCYCLLYAADNCYTKSTLLQVYKWLILVSLATWDKHNNVWKERDIFRSCHAKDMSNQYQVNRPFPMFHTFKFSKVTGISSHQIVSKKFKKIHDGLQNLNIIRHKSPHKNYLKLSSCIYISTNL